MKLKELRERTYKQVVEFIFHNPEASYKEVGEKFGISGVQASLLARKAGAAPRRRGRKSRKQN
jgi:DNA-directed RNA polymerase specialized sigma subunit